MKHGAIIQEHKHWNTKKIYNRGHLVMTYRYVPKYVEFKNPMINDDNQHFCGGWQIDGMDLSNAALLQRVLDGKKPMAVISCGEDLEALLKRVNPLKFHIVITSKDLIVGRKGRIGDMFDLQVLVQDYRRNQIMIDAENIQDKELCWFFSDWDCQPPNGTQQRWVTGLILGYPVENTISLYKI